MPHVCQAILALGMLQWAEEMKTIVLGKNTRNLGFFDS